MQEKTAKNQRQNIKIAGILTSQIQKRSEKTDDPYYYAFLKLKGQNIDLPVIFKIKCLAKCCKKKKTWVKPEVTKGQQIELTGNYSNSTQSIRKSFTAISYQLTAEENIVCHE